MKKIKLNNEVVVSDPCYTIPTWCQTIIDNVKPGYYQPFMKKHNAGDWGTRNSMLLVIHEDHQFDDLVWEEHPGTVGVDSGQAGIFSMESYRNDSITERIGLGDGDISFFGPIENSPKESGEIWYRSMCSRTMGVLHWGTYDEGVVCSSGFGDGSYQLFVSKVDGNIVAMCIDFGVEEGEVIDFEFFKDPIHNV